MHDYQFVLATIIMYDVAACSLSLYYKILSNNILDMSSKKFVPFYQNYFRDEINNCHKWIAMKLTLLLLGDLNFILPRKAKFPFDGGWYTEHKKFQVSCI